MLKTVKVAVSMSSEDFKVIEDIRKHDGITRSGVVVKAVRLLRNKSEKEKMIKAYEDGYKKYPEKLIEIKAREKACIETLSDEVWK
ncbi:MAG: hypothetical protein AABY50_07015 [Nitrospirota bacterium]